MRKLDLNTDLIGLKLFAAISLEGKQLYEVIAYDPESQKFRVRDTRTGKESSSFGNSIADFEIGIASRTPDDPLLQLMEAYRIPVIQFIARGETGRVLASQPEGLADVGIGRTEFRGGDRDAGRGPSGMGPDRRADAPSVRRPAPTNRDVTGAERAWEGSSRPRGRSVERSQARNGRRRRRSPSSGSGSSSDGGRRRRKRSKTPRKRRRRRRSVSVPSSTSVSGASELEASMSRKALVAHVSEIIRDRKVSGMKAELRRLQPSIPVEKKGLGAQFDMATKIHEVPNTWAGRLALGMALSTVIKSIHMNLTFLADALFRFARQRCEDYGRELSTKEQQKIDAEVWDFYQKQRTDGEKLLAKGGGSTTSGFQNR